MENKNKILLVDERVVCQLIKCLNALEQQVIQLQALTQSQQVIKGRGFADDSSEHCTKLLFHPSSSSFNFNPSEKSDMTGEKAKQNHILGSSFNVPSASEVSLAIKEVNQNRRYRTMMLGLGIELW